MRRKDLEKANRLNEELAELEKKLDRWRHTGLIEVSGVSGHHQMELSDYPPPSELGRTFEAVKCAVIDYWARAVDQKKTELAACGVNLEP